MNTKKEIKKLTMKQKEKLLNKILAWYKLYHEPELTKFIKEVKK